MRVAPVGSPEIVTVITSSLSTAVAVMVGKVAVPPFSLTLTPVLAAMVRVGG